MNEDAVDYDPHVPPIDWSALKEMHEIGADTEIIDLFLEEAPSQLEMMRTAWAGSDVARLRAVAHSLKSTSSYIGAVNVSALSAELEKRAREKNLEGVEGYVVQLAQELGRAIVELKKGYPKS